MRKDFGYLYNGAVTSNPLPDSWTVTPTQGKYTPRLGKQICAASYPGVQPCPPPGAKAFGNSGGVHWGSTVTKRVLTVAKVISLVFLIAGALAARPIERPRLSFSAAFAVRHLEAGEVQLLL